MGGYEREASTQVDAPPQACFDAMTDFEQMPQWQGPLRRCEVLSRGDDGRPHEVLYEVDAKVRTVSYRLRHDYDEPRRIGSAYAGGDFRDMDGEWRFEERDGGTLVSLRLRIDPGRWVPGPVQRMIEDAVMRRAVEDLKQRVER